MHIACNSKMLSPQTELIFLVSDPAGYAYVFLYPTNLGYVIPGLSEILLTSEATAYASNTLQVAYMRLRQWKTLRRVRLADVAESLAEVSENTSTWRLEGS